MKAAKSSDFIFGAAAEIKVKIVKIANRMGYCFSCQAFHLVFERLSLEKKFVNFSRCEYLDSSCLQYLSASLNWDLFLISKESEVFGTAQNVRQFSARIFFKAFMVGVCTAENRAVRCLSKFAVIMFKLFDPR